MQRLSIPLAVKAKSGRPACTYVRVDVLLGDGGEEQEQGDIPETETRKESKIALLSPSFPPFHFLSRKYPQGSFLPRLP